MYDSLCAELAAVLSENIEVAGDLKHKIELFVRNNDSLRHLSTMEKISLAQSWLWRIQGYDFLDSYLKDP